MSAPSLKEFIFPALMSAKQVNINLKLNQCNRHYKVYQTFGGVYEVEKRRILPPF